MDGQPFFEVASAALVFHVFGFIGAGLLEWAFNPRGWTRGLNSINATGKLFTTQRREVRFFLSWVLIWIARFGLIVAAAALIAGITQHNL